jgi:hypothetical protein
LFHENRGLADILFDDVEAYGHQPRATLSIKQDTLSIACENSQTSAMAEDNNYTRLNHYQSSTKFTAILDRLA